MADTRSFISDLPGLVKARDIYDRSCLMLLEWGDRPTDLWWVLHAAEVTQPEEGELLRLLPLGQCDLFLVWIRGWCYTGVRLNNLCCQNL